jgi:hypothetical protein
MEYNFNIQGWVGRDKENKEDNELKERALIWQQKK